MNVSVTGVDITGYTFFFTLRTVYDLADTTDANAVIKKTWTSNSASSTSITISAAEAKLQPMKYKYDVQYKDLADNITTLVYGDFEIINESTNRTS